MHDTVKSPRATEARSSLLRGLVAMVAPALLLAWAACGSDDTGGNNNTTSGTGGSEVQCNPEDFVYTNPDTAEQVCEGKCQQCLEGNDCVSNRCQLTCTSATDCANFNNANGYLANTQDCVGAKNDATADVQICQSNGKARGFGYECPFGDSWCFGDPARPDRQLQACPDGRPCGDPCAGNACVADELACRGVKDCTLGRCVNDLSPCVLSPATKALDPDPCPGLCQPMKCLGAGDGDADAYCTRFDCAADLDCPGGYYCGTFRDPHGICGTQKGDNSFCGQTSEPCVDLGALPPGSSYHEGNQCLERRACMKRSQCSSCETDIDCSQLPGQICSDTGDATKMCTRLCNLANQDKDCDPQYTCQPSPHDPSGAQGVCKPRFGKCKGDGAYCSTCNSDDDCGSGASCLQPGLSAERACMQFPLATSCTTDANCPKSPSGKFGECLDEAEGVDSTSGAYHKCYLPFDTAGGRFTCW